MNRNGFFLDSRRLFDGPWQAFERDTARLLIHSGFQNVRIVGGTGDQGADILAVNSGRLWVFQCKHTGHGLPPKSAFDEVVRAGGAYGADELCVVTSKPTNSDAFMKVKDDFLREGLRIRHWEPSQLQTLGERCPEYSPLRCELRPYQDYASDRLRQALLDTGRSQIVLATGLGKTVVMAETVADLYRDGLFPNGTVLVLAHTKPLVNQLHRSFWTQLPKWVCTHQIADGEWPTFWEGVTFATIQSVIRNIPRLPVFDLVLIDEAHHIGSDSFLKVVEQLNPKMLAGVTATPWRGDSFDIDTVLGPPQIKMGIADGLQKGFLSDVDYRLLADNLDWNEVQELSKNKYSLKQLNRKLIIPTRDDEAARIVYNTYLEEKCKSIICFSPTIDHTEFFAMTLRTYGLNTESVSSELTEREREIRLAKFRSGSYQCLTTVDLFNEGVDVPDVDMLVFLRATHSRRIFVQQLGRGLRLSKGKIRVVVLDFVSDLRRMAEVLELDKAVRGMAIEKLGMGKRLIEFNNHSAGSFLKEWILDQASLQKRLDDPFLELPEFEFPESIPPGNIQ